MMSPEFEAWWLSYSAGKATDAERAIAVRAWLAAYHQRRIDEHKELEE